MAKSVQTLVHILPFFLLSAGVAGACPSSPPAQSGFAPLSPPSLGAIVRAFGPRSDAESGLSTYHPGVDLGGNLGEPVRAAAAGEVVSVSVEGGYGRRIVIRHRALQLETAYAHLARMLVKAGDCVRQGQIIGEIGVSGLTRPPPHLHFEVLRTSGHGLAPIDPATVLPAYDKN